MVTDYVISTIQYIKNILQVEAIGAVVIIIFILFAMISIILLAFRRVRLWYWRINEQIKALESIDNSLEVIKQKMPDNFSTETIITSTEAEFLEQQESSKEECKTEIQSVNIQTETPKIVFDKKDKDERAIVKPGYNIGKTGKIYAEDTLREQIQF